jgi:uncharacterized protein (TIGR04255 family)
MTVTYGNAPLVELIAEVRWGAGGVTSQAGPPQAFQIAIPKTKDEELYMHLGALMSVAGYGRFERLIPPGFPSLPGQPACRFRPTDAVQPAPLYQVGNGVFTANALPPYRSWVEFHPVVAAGIDSLLEAHKRAAITPPDFNAVIVRYINAFRDNLTGGRTLQAFLREVLGIELTIPQAISSKATDPQAIKPVIQLAIPTAIGQLETTFAEGMHGNDRAIMADMAVQIPRQMGSDVHAVMQALSEGRQIIHDVFRGLTVPIHFAMEPMA